ncbi:hypothetical protein FS837_005028, partial [Tulasnella sp. UAMH 9824]
MITTRRRSAVSYQNSRDNGMAVDGFVHHYGASTSASKKRAAGDDLEYDSHEYETPQKKKTKTSQTTNQKGKVPARYLIKDLFATLPLELIYDVGDTLAPNMLGRKLYVLEQIAKMAEIVEGFRARIDAGVKGARAEFDEFIEKKKAEAAKQVESGKELKEWAMDGGKMRDVTEYQLKQQRKEAMVTKLVLLGHDPRDVRQAADKGRCDPNIFDSMRQLSDSVWKCVKSKAEMFVETEKQLRLDIEQKPTRDARRNVAKARFAKFKKTYDSSPDMFMPTESAFMDLPAIKSVVQSEGYDVSPSLFDDVFEQLPAFINKWRSERRVDLARILLQSRYTPGDAKPDPIAAEKEGILLLATSLFSSCTKWYPNVLLEHGIYWMDNMHEHFWDANRRHPPFKKSTLVSEQRCIRAIPEFSEKAKQLVQAVGLNPNTATSLDMDALDARFWCKDCSVVKNESEAVARNWRNCVMHLAFHALSSWKGWEVLADEDRATIAAMENAAST